MTSGWWGSFCDRHPNLTLRAPAPLSRACAAASDPTMLDHYFDLLQEVLDKNGLLDQACQIFTITVVACDNATGSVMPPMVILDRKTLPPRFTNGEIPGTGYGLSAKGWIDQEQFDGWFTDNFFLILCSLILSIENIRAIEEKERKKQEKGRLKEEHKRQMEN